MSWGNAPMGPLRGVLLAVLLLEVVVGADDENCATGNGGGEAEAAVCEFTEVEGFVATVLCGEVSSQTGDHARADPSPNSTRQMSVNNEKTISSNDVTYNETTNTPEEHLNMTYGGVHRDYKNNTLIQNATYDQHTTEKTRVDKRLNKSYQIQNSSTITHNECCSSFTTVKIYLNSSVAMLDLSPFKNVNTVTINTSNYSILKTCATKNVSNLSITSSSLNKVPNVRYLSGLKNLNLSLNNIVEVPVKGLPLTLISLDLSQNSIVCIENVHLPINLKVFNVSYNNITNCKNFSLIGSLSILVLKGNRLTFIPDIDIVSLEELYLSENNISCVKKYAFKKLTSLTVLDIRKNSLTSLEEKAFQGLNKLQLLDISENNIVSLAPATFQYLSNLVSLTLSRNDNLGSLKHEKDVSLLFGTSQRLQKIEASKTNLTRIPATLTRSVRQLFLAENYISSIQCGDLDSFPLLQTMDLSSNKVSEIEEDALGRLDFLSNLILYDNKLISIPKSLPDQLKVFDLRCNLVEQLSQLDFLGMQKLRVLLLSRNKITKIEDGAFGQLSSLEVLDLSHNPIKLLSRTSFIGPRRLKEIYLISLKDLIPLQEPLSFPAPESSHLEVLNVESSPVLASQLMEDVAALTMFHELFELNLNHCRLSTLRSDLPKYLPRLHKLELTGNSLNCSNIIWLVKWLQTLNISMQDRGRFRQEIYNLKDICCQKADAVESYSKTKVICASPEYLSGKEIISLEQENIPDLKLTSSTPPPTTQSFIMEHYLRETFVDSNTSPGVTNVIDSEFVRKVSVPNSTSVTSNSLLPGNFTALNSLSKQTELRSGSIKTKVSINPLTLEKTQVKLSKLVKTTKSINRESLKWKYLKSDSHKQSVEPAIVLFNGTKNTDTDFDNQVNESESDSDSLGAYLSLGHPPSSHPGMVVFLLLVSGLLLASAATLYSHTHRAQHYRQQQDIEVSSFSGNGNGNDLW